VASDPGEILVADRASVEPRRDVLDRRERRDPDAEQPADTIERCLRRIVGMLEPVDPDEHPDDLDVGRGAQERERRAQRGARRRHVLEDDDPVAVRGL